MVGKPKVAGIMVGMGIKELYVGGEAERKRGILMLRWPVEHGVVVNFENMEALSGGQKTIVSLALMLAIQRTDPPPFYLMDEVDAALDVQYRRRVVRLLAKLGTQVTHVSASSRTICTTPYPKSLQSHFSIRICMNWHIFVSRFMKVDFY